MSYWIYSYSSDVLPDLVDCELLHGVLRYSTILLDFLSNSTLFSQYSHGYILGNLFMTMKLIDGANFSLVFFFKARQHFCCLISCLYSLGREIYGKYAVKMLST